MIVFGFGGDHLVRLRREHLLIHIRGLGPFLQMLHALRKGKLLHGDGGVANVDALRWIVGMNLCEGDRAAQSPGGEGGRKSPAEMSGATHLGSFKPGLWAPGF